MDTPNLRRAVAVWIDHHTALIVKFVGARVEKEENLLAELGMPAHGTSWAQRLVEAHRHEQWKDFCEEIVDHFGPLDRILIVGPGSAKHELRLTIEHHQGLRGEVVALETTSRLSMDELIARADGFFGPVSR